MRDIGFSLVQDNDRVGCPVASQDISMRAIGLSLVQDNNRVGRPVLATTCFTRLLLSLDGFDLDLFSLEHGLKKVRMICTNWDGKLVLLLDHVLAIVDLGSDLEGKKRAKKHTWYCKIFFKSLAPRGENK
jgi:hypothetical protein